MSRWDETNLNLQVRVASAARRDIVSAMQWSTREFGRDAAERYDALVTQALEDIGAEPARPGSQARPDLGPGIFVYHVRFSRERARSARGIVRRPRHFVIYRVGNRVVDVLRVLHDSRELRRHLPSG